MRTDERARLTIDHGVNSIDPVVNTERHHAPRSIHPAATRQREWLPTLVGLYLAISIVTLVVLGLLSALGSKEATASAWVHAVIVSLFAVLLEMRMRASLRGSRRASVAIPIIATVLLVANIIEAAAPGAFPGWMRFEMVAIAVLMGGVIIISFRERVWR